MATTSSSAHLDLVRYIPQSLRQVQVRWFVRQLTGKVYGLGPYTVQISIIDHTGDIDVHKERICQRSAGENVEDFYDVPSHLLVPGHYYEINIKLMSRDQSSANDSEESNSNMLMQVLHKKILNFRLCEYAMLLLTSNLCYPMLTSRISYCFT